MENFAGDPYYLVSGTDESGIKFEIALHGWSGFFMFGESNVYKTRFENYSDKTGTLISGSSTGVLLYESGGVYFDVLTGKSVDLLRIEELKKQSAENDHNMFVDSYINVREKLDMKTIEKDIAFLIGYTVTA